MRTDWPLTALDKPNPAAPIAPSFTKSRLEKSLTIFLSFWCGIETFVPQLRWRSLIQAGVPITDRPARGA
jgi:hypothetical protein